jgi:hypothetical protein
MNTLSNISEELIGSIFSGNLKDWLACDRKKFYDLDFMNFQKKDDFKKFGNKDLNCLINILLYFKFIIEKKKKLFLSKLYYFQISCPLTFFTKTISFYIRNSGISDIFSIDVFVEPLKKLFYGILMNKKLNEMKKNIEFWTTRHLNFLTIENMNRSHQEIIKSKIIYTENIEFYTKEYFSKQTRLYLLKKRFKCFFPVFFAQKFIFIENRYFSQNFFRKFFSFEINHSFEKLFIKKIFNIFLALIKSYFSHTNFIFNKKFFRFNKKYHVKKEKYNQKKKKKLTKNRKTGKIKFISYINKKISLKLDPKKNKIKKIISRNCIFDPFNSMV